MKANYKICPNLVVEVEADSQADLFEELASAYEVFSTFGEACGLCKSLNVKPQVRRVDKSKYYEVKCTSCNGVLAIGLHDDKNKSLYPKRKLIKATGLPAKVEEKEGPFDWSTRGWHKYDKDKVMKNNDKSPKQTTKK